VETVRGGRRHAFEIALDRIEEKRIRVDVVPEAAYPIGAYRQALRDLPNKESSQIVKAALDFRNEG
jgi:threonine dehydrogenase-like Zn-dependent dehydrogenase